MAQLPLGLQTELSGRIVGRRTPPLTSMGIYLGTPPIVSSAVSGGQPTTMGQKLNVVDPSGVTNVDWAAVNRVNRV